MSPTRSRISTLLAVTLAGTVMTASASGQAQTKPPGLDPEINKPFADPDVKAFVARFETETREVYARRVAIVKALDLKPGMAVADVGAGTGAFTRLIAERVGPEGKVYAVDISEAFLKHLADSSEKLGQTQVQPVRATQQSTGLAAGAVDLAFLCDSYHHFENPAKTLASLRRALRKGGQLVVVDFDRVKGKSSEFVMKHVRADKAGFTAEIKAAGFEPVPAPNAPALKENFFLRFRRTDDPAPKPVGPVGG